MPKVAHLTSAHPRNDARIFLKQCRSLARHGYQVTLVVADDRGDELADGVQIVDVGSTAGRLNRIVRTTRRVFDRALSLEADIYQLHDPELIPAGLRLKRMGKKVIFDSHEDVPSQLLGKHYLGPMGQRLLSNSFSAYERYACRRFDGIIAATPFIRNKFLQINPRSVDVNNYPVLREFDGAARWADKSARVCYVGGLAAARGLRELVQACDALKSGARVALAGSFDQAGLAAEVAACPGWARIDLLGYLDRPGVGALMADAMAGLVTLHPTPNHLDALPVKMFEYMAAGIPVIASHFTLWREIVEGHQCGLCVDPFDPNAIAAAIDYLVQHPGVAARMGANGRRAVREKFNWPVESAKLISFYEHL